MALRIESDFESAGLDARRASILRFATKLTSAPAEMDADDVASLRHVSCSDEDILAIVEVTAYYAYVNRIAQALGVELENRDEDRPE